MSNARDLELERLQQDEQRSQRWRLWGTYLSARQWGTVREDYSASGDPWSYFPHDHARSRAYRWGEDGLLGITDEHCRLCFALAVWNGADPILKERLFGLTGPEGNHGEDVKELYYYQDATPTHSYCRALYKYPQASFPYQLLVEENRRRSREQGEFELLDTGIFDEDRYFDVTVEYAKAAPTDILIRLTIANRGAQAAELHVLPTLWFRNTWSWGELEEEATARPSIRSHDASALIAVHESLGSYYLAYEASDSLVECLYTDNDTNFARLFGVANARPYVKDGIHEAVVRGRREAVNPAAIGTKAAVHYKLTVGARSAITLRLRLQAETRPADAALGSDFERVFQQRLLEAEHFYAARLEPSLGAEQRRIARAAYAGLLWCKQFYELVQSRWSSGDPTQPAPPPGHAGRNADWLHIYARDVLSMPDNWEFPYFCAWDLAFHCVCLSKIDADFAKRQLILLLREWYMHRNGQLPAYEFAFSDVNPPVHPWAVWRVYRLPEIDRSSPDRGFLERAFQKLLLNFTWWVNREDPEGNNLFSGGFLGLDNIGAFDRSRPLPNGGRLQQADGTAWMAFYCVHMLSMALELARSDDVYQDLASKFVEHFTAISSAINNFGGTGLWDEEDGFYYDRVALDGRSEPLRVRAVSGFLPMLAVTIIRDEDVKQFTGFTQRLKWDAKFRPAQLEHSLQTNANGTEHLLSVLSRERLERLLRRLFDEDEFLSPFGIRSMSRFHAQYPRVYMTAGATYTVDYEPGEGTHGDFGGNSNWRGPVWFPINYLILESLRTYHLFYGDSLRVEFPTRSGTWVTLGEAARNVAHRMQSLFLPDRGGRRPCYGAETRYADDAHWRELLLFNEYYHADSGRGCGASHQTGWTALIADLLNLEPHWTANRPRFVD